MQSTPDDAYVSKNIPVHLDPAASYVDLKTGKSLKLRVDTATKYVVDASSNEPVMYYIDPATNDTFDRRGRLVSRALIRGTNGDYTVVESRITITSGNDNTDNNNIAGSDTSSNAATDESTQSGNSKTKIKDDLFKQKTDTTKVKMKNDKIKIKTEPRQ
jgi:hypothetical protein